MSQATAKRVCGTRCPSRSTLPSERVARRLCTCSCGGGDDIGGKLCTMSSKTALSAAFCTFCTRSDTVVSLASMTSTWSGTDLSLSLSPLSRPSPEKYSSTEGFSRSTRCVLDAASALCWISSFCGEGDDSCGADTAVDAGVFIDMSIGEDWKCVE